MEKNKEDIYIKCLLEEVGNNILTGEDALNMIATRDTHTDINPKEMGI